VAPDVMGVDPVHFLLAVILIVFFFSCIAFTIWEGLSRVSRWRKRRRMSRRRQGYIKLNRRNYR
jgi:hypothetical protein